MTSQADASALIGRLAVLEAAIVFLMRREFERETVPRVAATKWFEKAMDASARLEQLPSESDTGLDAERVAESAYRELVQMRRLVLDGML